MKPRRESQRPLLPQHARHCPVLEAGSSLGFLVYPALEQNESFHIEYEGEGRYQFVYFMATSAGKWEPVFTVTIVLSIGSIGMIKEEVAFASKKVAMSREAALNILRTFIVPEDLGTPAGAISMRGATNFKTPPGWDTVYTPIFNMIERPVAPMLVVRVETDWYAHESEFRYVLQPGEGIQGARNMPIGQVFFLSREEITVQDCTKEELAEIHRSQAEFFREKAAHKIMTPYGLEYSPHYLRQSRSRNSGSDKEN
ncbi:MAG TPA: hypothetical protein VER98_00700 [Terriglobia bacterium]|nr:hypothetical protein [Terriglobia bacterium]